MHMLPTPSPLVETFLRHLGAEERLLAAVLEKANEVTETLRRGDLRAATAAGAEQHELAAALRAASGARLDAAGALARALNTSHDPLTLAALAEHLPEPERGAVLAARERLAAVAADLNRIQTRNANLLGHLRSFFRGVLSDITADDAPARYGPSGSWLAPALLTRGTLNE